MLNVKHPFQESQLKTSARINDFKETSTEPSWLCRRGGVTCITQEEIIII